MSSGLCETEASNHSLPPSPRLTENETLKKAEEEVPETEEEKAKRLLYCSLCRVAVNSASQLQAHKSGEKLFKPRCAALDSQLMRLHVCSGTKHKTMLEARSGEGAIKSFPRTGVKSKMAAPSESPTGLQNKTFHCEICDVHVNSETQLKQVSWFKRNSMWGLDVVA